MKNKFFYEVSVPEGLEALAWEEISQRLGERVKLLQPVEQFAGLLQFTYGDSPKRLLGLKSVFSLFSGQKFDAPRPKALLGHQNFTSLTDQLQSVMKLQPAGTFRTFYLAAAGSDSKVMQRISREVVELTNLKPVQNEGDLLLRVRRPLDGEDSWEALIRMTPRPLSVRRWRQCDYEGALNAAVAYAVARLTRPHAEDVFLNMACGSASILIERAAIETAARLIGCDTNPEALECAKTNVEAAGYTGKIELQPWDARQLPLPDASVDVVCSDLPFGHDVGSHDENLLLYPHLLKEAARVTKPGGRAVFITHEVRLMETVLNVSLNWELEEILPITINGLHPRIYVMSRL